MTFPNFNNPPDLVYYGPKNSSSSGTRLNIPNTVNILEIADTEYLYSSSDITSSNIIGKKMIQYVLDTSTGSFPSVGEQFSSFIFFPAPYTSMSQLSSISIISGRTGDYGQEPNLTISRVISGSGDFTFSSGYALREDIVSNTVFKYSIWLSPNN
jgi:hypothetical protein